MVHPDSMPLLHLIDQHVYRGVAHQVLDFPTTQPSNNAFGPRFRTLFHAVTGFNPRLASANPNAAARPLASTGRLTRRATPCRPCAARSTRSGSRSLRTSTRRNRSPRRSGPRVLRRVSVDPAIISQAVGPIKVVQSHLQAGEHRGLQGRPRPREAPRGGRDAHGVEGPDRAAGHAQQRRGGGLCAVARREAQARDHPDAPRPRPSARRGPSRNWAWA